jgi:hypothetical protein
MSLGDAPSRRDVLQNNTEKLGSVFPIILDNRTMDHGWALEIVRI